MDTKKINLLLIIPTILIIIGIICFSFLYMGITTMTHDCEYMQHLSGLFFVGIIITIGGLASLIFLLFSKKKLTK